MSGINKVILVGYVGKDPEVRYLDGGVAVAKLSLATTEVFKNKEGKKVEHTEWHSVVFWRGLAEVVEKYVKKGNQLYIEGRIKYRTFGEGDNKKYYTDIIAENMTMLGAKRERDANTTITETKLIDSPMPVEIAEPADDLPF
jgi:single-strand DNA-binding protein